MPNPLQHEADAELFFGEDLLHVGDRPGHFGTDFELPSYNTARMFVAYDVTSNLEIRADVDKLLMRSFT